MDDTFPTNDDMDKMYQQHLRDEFSSNKESIDKQREDFKKQMQEARTGQRQQTHEQQQSFKAANDNRQNEADTPNTHNTGKGQDTQNAREKFKQEMRAAREGREQRAQEQGENREDLTGQQGRKTSEHHVNAKDITEKEKDSKDPVEKPAPKPQPGRNFTRTWGPDRD